MSVNHCRGLRYACIEVHERCHFVNEVARMGPEDMGAEDPAAPLLGNDFAVTFRFTACQSLAVCTVLAFMDPVRYSAPGAVLFGKAYRRKFRLRKDSGRADIQPDIDIG